MSGERSIGGVLIALALSLHVAGAYAQAPADAPATGGQGRTPAGETLKERLSDKASDEQRVDNCKVPKDRRGTKARPEGCAQENVARTNPPH
ncbi:MAG: hypothetical protein ACLQJR_20195 [Stellaceae bacterium]